jgi:tryptophanyl-tRNA synthetase
MFSQLGTDVKQKRRLTGFQSTGILHLGNYFGAIRSTLEIQKDHDLFLFIANLHALNSVQNARDLKTYTYDMAAVLLALGVDPGHTVFFRQSDVPEVTELCWILSCFTGMGLLERAHAYKDARAKGKDMNSGVFFYPVLMAADILLYDADEVPVGKDQKQHLEMARDMALRVNSALGKPIFKLPEPIIREEVMVVPGLDGQKMSKSYHNTIAIFEDEKSLKKKILGMVTDSSELEASKPVDGTLIYELYKLFATQAQQQDFRGRMAAGGMGWGHAKVELFELIRAAFREPRLRYAELIKDTAHLDAILAEGSERARDVASKKIQSLKSVMGLA